MKTTRKILRTIFLFPAQVLAALACIVMSASAWSAPQISVAPGTPYAFGTKALGSTTTQTFTVTSTIPVAVKITAIAPPAAGFAITGGTCAVGYTFGAPCTLAASFTPTAAVSYVGTILISTMTVGGVAGTPVAIDLSGSGAAAALPAITVSPTTLAFPNVVAGQQSTALNFTVRNSGTVNATISNIGGSQNIAGGFAGITSACIGVTLAPGQTCIVPFQFTPPSPGTYSGIVTFFLLGSSSVAAQTYLTGVASAPTLLPPTIATSSGTYAPTLVESVSAPVVITVKNPNAQSISLTGYTVNSAFVVMSTTCTTSLAAGQSCTYTVTFNPTVAGPQSSPFTVNTNAGSVMLTLSATGVAVTVPGGAVTLTPASSDFGSTAVGGQSTPRPFTLQNTTATPITSLQIAVTPGFSQSNTCGASLAGGASCTITVLYKPTALGNTSGMLTVSAPASPPSPAISLSATLTGTTFVPTPVVSSSGSLISANPRAIQASLTAATSHFIAYSFTNGIPRVNAADAVFCTKLTIPTPTTGATGNYPCASNSEFARHPTDRATLQTVQQNGSVVRATETIRIPSAVTRAAQALGATTFYFVRRFEPQGFAVVEIRATGAIMNAPIALTDVRLAFDTSQGPQPLVFVERGASLPAVTATLYYTGSGVLRGRWELVQPGDVAPTENDLLPEASLPRDARGTQRRYMLLQRFEQWLPGNGRTEIKVPAFSPAYGATQLDGQYQLLLRIEAEPSIYGGESGAANFAMPLLRYFVGSITAPATRMAPITAKVKFNGARPTFSWSPVPQARYYRIEVADRNKVVTYSAIMRDTDRSYSALSGLTVTSGSRWRVQALDESLQPLGESPWHAINAQ
jgi:hypothetical protein